MIVFMCMFMIALIQEMRLLFTLLYELLSDVAPADWRLETLH